MRPAPIHLRASVREPRPAFESTRSKVLSGRWPFLSFTDVQGSISQISRIKHINTLLFLFVVVWKQRIFTSPFSCQRMSQVTLVKGARQLLTLRGPSGPRRGDD